MRIGVVFPQTEIGQDPAVIRDYAQAVEAMGYTHILAFDSVVGANPDRPGGWTSQYTYQHAFHEPFVLFGFCAGVTRSIELVTGVVILPQRQATLVAKQAAAVDVLSGGRLRLGIGVGWNPVEFEALGENFANRGKRVEEQLEVMRRLWTRELVTYEGRWHRVPDAGINPLPVQRPIPVWMGGESEVVLRRAARLADGWITLQTFRPGPAAQSTIDRLHGYLREAGRDPAAFGIEGRVALAQIPPAEHAKELAAWRAMRGVTHLCVNTMGLGLASPTDHVRTLERFKKDGLGKISAMAHDPLSSAYRRDGFVVVPELLGPQQLAELREVIAELVAAAGSVDMHTAVYDLEPGHTQAEPRVRRIKQPHKVHPAFDAVVRSGPVMEVLTELLGPDLRLQGSKLNMKAARYGSPVEWHQDWAFYPHTNDDMLAIGVMLDDMDLENGPLMVVPGSHKGPIWNHHGEDGRFCGLVNPEDIEAEAATAVALTGRAGSMSFHHVRALHGSALNTSDRSRNLLLYEVAAADAWPLLGVADFDDFNRRLLSGRPTVEPRVTSVPVRLPLPPAARQGSIYENQAGAARFYFDRAV